MNNYTAPNQTQRNTTDCSYIGTSGGQASAYGDMSYTSAYNQHNNDIKSSTIANHPNMGGTQIFNQNMNISCSKQDTNRFDCRVNPGLSVTALPPSIQNYGAINMPQQLENENKNRLDGNLLDAFKNNPYTQSLMSF